MDNALDIDGVSKHYEGFSLDEVSFTLPRGYIMGLIGPNGAGKTTLVKLILNLVRRDGGSIRVFGLDNLTAESEAKSRLGFVPDDELQVYLRAADVVATPFLEILTSGSVLLAMSFERAVIAPRRGCVAETVGDDGGILYDADDR